MTMSINRIVQPTADALADRLAKDVAKVLSTAIAERGRASAVVSGGSTPLPMFQCLAKDASVDWSRVTITLADERAVPADHDDSNERFAFTHLFQGAAQAASFVSLLPEDLFALDDLTAVAERVDAMADVFDVVLLGMGGDGHTASLFPDAPELEFAMQTDQSVTALHPPSVSQARISLSAQRLLKSRHMWLHISGDAKAAVLQEALAEGSLPIARLLENATQRELDTAIYSTS